MNRFTRVLTVLAVLFFSLPASAQLFDGDKEVTIALTGDFTWESKAPLENILGTAKGAKGSVTMAAGDMSKVRGKISVPVKDMETGNKLRDKHLKDTDWLDAGAHPQIVFEVVSIEKASFTNADDVRVGKGTAKGSITIHGKTQEIKASVVAKAKGGKVKFDIEFKVRLADYDIKGSRGTIGKKVGETIAIKGTLRGEAQ